MVTLFDRLFLQPVCLWPCPNIEMNRQSFFNGVILEVEKLAKNATEAQLVRTSVEVCEPTQATGFAARKSWFERSSLALPLTAQNIRDLVQPMFDLVCEVPTIEWSWTIFLFMQMNGQILEFSSLIDPKSTLLLC